MNRDIRNIPSLSFSFRNKQSLGETGQWWEKERKWELRGSFCSGCEGLAADLSCAVLIDTLRFLPLSEQLTPDTHICAHLEYYLQPFIYGHIHLSLIIYLPVHPFSHQIFHLFTQSSILSVNSIIIFLCLHFFFRLLLHQLFAFV